MLNNSNTIPKYCDVRILKGNIEIYHKLKVGNEWIFALTEPQRLRITCGNDIDFNLEDIGIITISRECKGYANAQVLIPSKII